MGGLVGFRNHDCVFELLYFREIWIRKSRDFFGEVTKDFGIE